MSGSSADSYVRSMAFGWLKDRLSDIADAAWDAATTVAEAAWDAASEVADTAVDAVGYVAANTGDVIGTVGTVVDTATFGAASAVLDVVDNTVLDTVDELTGGTSTSTSTTATSASVGVDGVAARGRRRSVTTASATPPTCSTRATTSAPRRRAGTSRVKPASTGARCRTPKATSPSSADGDIAARRPRAGHVADAYRRRSPARPRPRSCEKATCGAPASTPTESCPPQRRHRGRRCRCGLRRHARRISAQRRRRGLLHRPGVGTVGGSLGYDRIETSDGVAEHFEAGGYASGYGVQVEAGVEAHQRHDCRRDDEHVGRQRRLARRPHRPGTVSGGGHRVSPRKFALAMRRQRRGERRRHVRRSGLSPGREQDHHTQRKYRNGLVRQAEGLGRGQAGRRRGRARRRRQLAQGEGGGPRWRQSVGQQDHRQDRRLRAQREQIVDKATDAVDRLRRWRDQGNVGRRRREHRQGDHRRRCRGRQRRWRRRRRLVRQGHRLLRRQARGHLGRGRREQGEGRPRRRRSGRRHGTPPAAARLGPAASTTTAADLARHQQASADRRRLPRPPPAMSSATDVAPPAMDRPFRCRRRRWTLRPGTPRRWRRSRCPSR